MVNSGRDGAPHTRFERAAARFLRDPDVTRGTGFGSSPGLRVSGKIFAMLVGDALVVKLPSARVDQLVATGIAARFDAGKGRPLRQWARVPPGSNVDWEQLTNEAQAFVAQR
jgi:hypothetical protein